MITQKEIKVKRKKMPQPQFCKMFTLETVAINIMQEKIIPNTELGWINI